MQKGQGMHNKDFFLKKRCREEGEKNRSTLNLGAIKHEIKKGENWGHWVALCIQYPIKFYLTSFV